MVDAGLGSAIVLEQHVRSHPAKLNVIAVPLSDEWATKKSVIACIGPDQLDQAARTLRDFLVAQAKGSSGRLE